MFGSNNNAYDNKPFYGPSGDNPNYMYERPSRPFLGPDSYHNGIKPPSSGFYDYGKPQKPFNYEDNNKPSTTKPSKGDYDKPSVSKPSGNEDGYENKQKPGDSSTGKPIVTESIGYNGEHITSIITELKDGEFFPFKKHRKLSLIFSIPANEI